MRLVDPEILASAALRLTAPDLGNLTRIAVELGTGPADRLDLGWRLRLEFDELERLGGWLRMADGNDRMVIGLCQPPLDQRNGARKPRQGALFEDTEFAPLPSRSPNGRPSIKGAVIDEAIRIMVPAGVAENRVRSFIGRLFSLHGLGSVAEAVYSLSRVDVVPDPVAWIQASLRRGRKGAPSQHGSPTGRPGSSLSERQEPAPAKPLATPEFLGISPARAAEIRAQNRSLRLKIKER